MTDAQARARGLWDRLIREPILTNEQSLAAIVAFAAQVEAETWEKAAAMIEEYQVDPQNPHNPSDLSAINNYLGIMVMDVRQRAQRAKEDGK